MKCSICGENRVRCTDHTKLSSICPYCGETYTEIGAEEDQPAQNIGKKECCVREEEQ